MLNDINSNYRHELKYLVSSSQIEILKARLKGLMAFDSHVSERGVYNVRSLYFDDYANSCYYDNENGSDHRKKYRVRIYNYSPEIIHLELKRKDYGMTLKHSYPLTLEQTKNFCAGKISTALTFSCQELLELLYMRPAIIVDYDRIPYVYKLGNVRVTFDVNISSSRAFELFWEKNIPSRPILPAGTHILEVKFDDYLPDFIYESLQLNDLQQTAFSKYYLCRRYSI